MRRFSFVFVVLYLFLSSCSIQPAPSRKLIFLNAHPKLGGARVKNLSITIELSGCKPIFDRLSVYAQTGEFEMVQAPDYVWVDTPCNMIKESLVRTFSKAGFRVVEYSKEKLSFRLFEFQPVFESNKRYCKILASFTLKTKGSIRTLLYRRRKLIGKKGEFVSCLNSLVSDMDSQVLNWVYENLNSKH